MDLGGGAADGSLARRRRRQRRKPRIGQALRRREARCFVLRLGGGPCSGCCRRRARRCRFGRRDGRGQARDAACGRLSRSKRRSGPRIGSDDRRLALARRGQIDERRRGAQLVPEVADRAEREHPKHTHRDVEGHARVGLAELRFEHLLRARATRGLVIARPWRWRARRGRFGPLQRLGSELRCWSIGRWRGVGRRRAEIVAHDLERRRDVGKLIAREHRLALGGFRRRLGLLAGLAARAALRLLLGALGFLQRFEQQAHRGPMGGPTVPGFGLAKKSSFGS